jgi:hypothetical protein
LNRTIPPRIAHRLQGLPVMRAETGIDYAAWSSQGRHVLVL